MSRVEFAGIDDLKPLVGKEVFVSDWLEVTQERINQFAEATGDFQWIHVDVERAKQESPFGGTVAHGFLTLSLLAKFSSESVYIARKSSAVNLGLNKVRFINPVRAGARIRGREPWPPSSPSRAALKWSGHRSWTLKARSGRPAWPSLSPATSTSRPLAS
jgi:acyl dehydratase